MDKLPLRYIETDIVNRCNLNCKGCGHFSPLYKNDTWEKDIAEFEKELTRLNDIFYVLKLRIMGGEPLLHSNWLGMLKVARKCLPNSQIWLVTNGLLIDKIISNADIINELEIGICISNYGVKPIPQEFYDRILYNKITSKNMFYKLNIDKDGKCDSRNSFINCNSNQCYQLRDGRIYSCPEMLHLKQFSKTFNLEMNLNPDDYSISIEQDADSIITFLAVNHKSCSYCNMSKRNEFEYSWDKSKLDINEWLE